MSFAIMYAIDHVIIITGINNKLNNIIFAIFYLFIYYLKVNKFRN
jgi:hypothetical protein